MKVKWSAPEQQVASFIFLGDLFLNQPIKFFNIKTNTVLI